MPDFSKTPLKTREEANEWLRYFNMSAIPTILDLIFGWNIGTVSQTINEGGHYHEDTTPDEVEYEAYFNVASVLYRIDRPIVQT